MKVYDFNLTQTLECGQCFNFEKIDTDSDSSIEYVVCAMGRALHVKQTFKAASCTAAAHGSTDASDGDVIPAGRGASGGKDVHVSADASDADIIPEPNGNIISAGRDASGTDVIPGSRNFSCGAVMHSSAAAGSGMVSELEFLNASADDVEYIWIPYFDLNRNYSEIKYAVASADSRLKSVIEKYYGMRILNQDFCETLISFIISQNKNIPQIKKCVKAICRQAGPCLGDINGKKYYGFPSLDSLSQMSEQDFRDIKCGFRAPYIVGAIKHMAGGLNAQELSAGGYDEAKEKLISIRGVGDKVANCVLLFSLGFREAFPVDVWIKRIMQDLYFGGTETPKPVIEAKGRELFGRYGGYAQQYLFTYAREK